MKRRCVGSNMPPNPPVCLPGNGPLRSFCGTCGREYTLSKRGLIRAHYVPEVRERYRCPVCHRTAVPTERYNLIRSHADTAGNSCPAAGYPFRIAETIDAIELVG